MRIRILTVIGICLLMLFGCSSENMDNNPVFQEANEIKTNVDQSNWDHAKQQAESLKKLYKENKWKYQLLSDKNTFNSLEEHIEMLTVSLEEKDKTEAKLHIAMIEHLIKSIYFKD